MRKKWNSLLNNLDTILAIVLCVGAAVFGFSGGSTTLLLAGIATILGLHAAIIIRDRNTRETLQLEIKNLESTLLGFKTKPTADSIFRRSTVNSDRDILTQAQEEIWVIQETGSFLLEQPTKLREFIKKGGKVKAILVTNELPIIEMLSLRNSDVKTPSAMILRQNEAASRIELLKEDIATFSENLEIRHIAYPIDVTAIFSDPESADLTKRLALVRLVGFKTPFEEKREFPVAFSLEPETYQYFIQQFQKMWQQSK